MTINEKIELVKSLIIEIQENNFHQNQDDIRSITNCILYQQTENFLFGLIQSKSFFEIENFRTTIDPEIESQEFDIKRVNYEGFLKNAFFASIFVAIETHIRHIANHFEKSERDINVNSIKLTFNNLTNTTKTNHFSLLSQNDKSLFHFYCYLRNTMHDIGFQSDYNSNQTLIIQDKNSVITKERIELKLISGEANNINFKKLILLIEQIIKLIFKIDHLIPNFENIKHKLVDIHFNG